VVLSAETPAVFSFVEHLCVSSASLDGRKERGRETRQKNEFEKNEGEIEEEEEEEEVIRFKKIRINNSSVCETINLATQW